jgi:hypothetical protein
MQNQKEKNLVRHFPSINKISGPAPPFHTFLRLYNINLTGGKGHHFQQNFSRISFLLEKTCAWPLSKFNREYKGKFSSYKL